MQDKLTIPELLIVKDLLKDKIDECDDTLRFMESKELRMLLHKIHDEIISRGSTGWDSL
jgi:hypothetical protein